MTFPLWVVVEISSVIRVTKRNFIWSLTELKIETAAFTTLVAALNRTEQLSECHPAGLAFLSVW